MERILSCVLAVGCLGTSSLFVREIVRTPITTQAATDGAFRDGLYLGKLDRAAGRTVAPPIARWSSDKDRESFVRGYRQAFGHDGVRLNAMAK